MFTLEDVEKLAELSRISISADEKERVRGELDAILRYISEIQKLKSDSSGYEKGGMRNVMRKDDSPHEPGAYSKDILAQAPKQRDGFIEVKKILSQY